MDTHSYKGWLNSDSFWKRAWAIYGYQLALGLAVWLVIMGIAVIISGLNVLFGKGY